MTQPTDDIKPAAFPGLPEYRATSFAMYWEPVMGSGERIAAIVAAVGDDGQVLVVPVIAERVLEAMYPGQGKAARNLIEFVSSALEKILASDASPGVWDAPFMGFRQGQIRSTLGSDISDIIEQVKLLDCSLWKGSEVAPDSADDIKLPELPKPYTRVEPVRSGLMEYTGADMDAHAHTAVLADRERQQQKLPANWDEDSSLETWFPLTAEELERLRAENAELRKDAKRYRYLRSRDLDAIQKGGIFVGMTPDNVVLNEEDLDAEIDAAMAREEQQ